MNEHKDRKPAGPKPALPGRRTINVSLTDELIERAREIGRGNISRGAREAIEKYTQIEKINYINDDQG